MHVVASSDSLGCDDLIPAACESINVDISVEELLETDGYGYIALLAYDIEGITGVEFALEGWPTGRGAPVLHGPYWCQEDATTFGDELESGGATALGECVEPDSTSGLALLGYLTFGPLDSTDVPIQLTFIPSTYTEPEDSILAVTDCTEDFEIDDVVASSGCAVGGTFSGTGPECPGEADGGGDDAPLGPLLAQFIGSRTQEAGDSFNIALVGSGLSPDVDVYLRQGLAQRRALFEGRAWRVFNFRVRTEAGDSGYWDIVVERHDDELVLPEAVQLVENSIRAAFDSFMASGVGFLVAGVVEVKFKRSAFAFPQGRRAVSPSEIADWPTGLRELLEQHQVSWIEKVFPTADPGDPKTETLARFFRLRFPSSLDVGDVLVSLGRLPDVVSASWISELQPCAVGDSLPNDPLYLAVGDTTQWYLQEWSALYPEVADIDMPDAWDLLGTTTENMLIAILDTGLRYSHEDLGDTTAFPNWLSPCGYDMVHEVHDPMESSTSSDKCTRGHGTIVSSMAVTATNNGKGMASATWGTTRLAPFKICDPDSEDLNAFDFMPEAIRWAVDSCQVDAINVSWIGARTGAFGAAVEYAHRVGRVFFTASTGNEEGLLQFYPASYPYVTGVTQTTRSGCWGDGWVMTNTHNPQFASAYCPLAYCDSSGAMPIWMTDLAAPGGGQIRGGYNNDLPRVCCVDDDSCYGGESGTSLAAPLVAGVGVYVKDRAESLGITLHPEDIEGLLCATTDPVAIMNSDGTCSDDFFDTYPNTYCGWGKINAFKAAMRIYAGQDDADRQLGTYTLRRFTATGYDTCWQDAQYEYRGWPDEGDTSFFYRHRLRKAVQYTGFTYEGPPFAWGYCASYANTGSIANPKRTGTYGIDPDEMEWKWSGVIPSSMTPQGCTLESFLWSYIVKGTQDTVWVTVPPDSMVWGCGVSGSNIAGTSVPATPAEGLQPTLIVEPNFPNPFNPETAIRFSIVHGGRLQARVYDVRGRLVRILLDEVVEAGNHELLWDGLNQQGIPVASGVYFLRVEAGRSAETRKMILLK